MFNMQNAHVDDLDLRSIRFLATLLETVSITRTGEVFGLSQPASSRAVERLRRAIGDPLIVRGSRGYVLTQRAEALKPYVAAAQGGIDAVFAPDVFDPSTAVRSFRIGSTDYGAITVLSTLCHSLTASAPGVSLEIAPWAGDTLKRLEDGYLDAALYPEAPLPQDFHFKTLFSDTYVIVLDPAHAPANKLTLDEALQRRRVVVLYPDGQRLLPDDLLGKLGAPGFLIAMRTPYFTTATWGIRDTDMVVALPRRVAEKLIETSPITLFAMPVSFPGFEYRLIWHARTHRDPGHRWLRSLMTRE